MNTIKATTTVACYTCGSLLPRQKTFKVQATTEEEAIEESNMKIRLWRASLKGTNCRTCQSILDSTQGTEAS